MDLEEDKKLLEKEIADLNKEIISLAYHLREVLEVDCSFGACVYDPRVDDIEKKMKEVQEKKELLLRIKLGLKRSNS